MNDRDPTERDHWDIFADSMDLTIEGHRLIAEEIMYEVKLLWRGTISWLRDLSGIGAPRQPTPPT